MSGAADVTGPGASDAPGPCHAPAPVEYRELADWPGYRVGADRSVWSRLRRGPKGGGVGPPPWRRLSVVVVAGPRSRREWANLRRGGRTWRVRLDALVVAAFPELADAGDDRPEGPPPGLELRPVPGWPSYYVGADRSVWSRRPLGVPRTANAPAAPLPLPWRRLDVRRSDGRVSMTRGGCRRWIPLDALVRATFNDNDGPPAGVALRPVPGFPGVEAGPDFTLWHRPPDAGSEALGIAPPRRRLAPSVGRDGRPVARLDVGGRRETVPFARLARAAFPPAEPSRPADPSTDRPTACTGGPTPSPCPSGDGRPRGVEFRPVAGFPGYEVGADRSVWSRRPTRAVGPAVWRRLAFDARNPRRPLVVLYCDRLPRVRRVDELWREAFPVLLPSGRAGAECQALGSDHGRAKLDEEKVAEARRLKAQGWSQRALMARYGVGRVTLFYAITGRTWSHVPMTPPAEGVEP